MAEAVAALPDFTAADKLKYGAFASDADETTFLALFSGYDKLGGDGQAWADSAAWFGALNDNLKLKTLTSCIIFMEKPVRFLVTGKTKKMATAGTAAKTTIDATIHTFLPKLTQAEVDAMEPVDSAKMKVSRQSWPADFQLINMSRIKRVALLGLQHSNKSNKVMKDWYKLYAGKPDVAVIPTKISGQTKTIKEGMFSNFKNSKGIWETAPIIAHFQFT